MIANIYVIIMVIYNSFIDYLNLKLISNIQFQLCIRKIMLYYRISVKKILITKMLASLAIHTSSVTAIQMQHIADMKFQLHQFNLEKCFIQKIQEIDLRHSCQNLCASSSVDIYKFGKEIISNIECQLILVIRKFLFTNITKKDC